MKILRLILIVLCLPVWSASAGIVIGGGGGGTVVLITNGILSVSFTNWTAGSNQVINGIAYLGTNGLGGVSFPYSGNIIVTNAESISMMSSNGISILTLQTNLTVIGYNSPSNNVTCSVAIGGNIIFNGGDCSDAAGVGDSIKFSSYDSVLGGGAQGGGHNALVGFNNNSSNATGNASIGPNVNAINSGSGAFVGANIVASGSSNSVAIGAQSVVSNSFRSIAIGRYARAAGTDNIAIGGGNLVSQSARVTNETTSGAIQLGPGTHSGSNNTLQVRDFMLLDAYGKVPADRLTALASNAAPTTVVSTTLPTIGDVRTNGLTRLLINASFVLGDGGVVSINQAVGNNTNVLGMLAYDVGGIDAFGGTVILSETVTVDPGALYWAENVNGANTITNWLERIQ